MTEFCRLVYVYLSGANNFMTVFKTLLSIFFYCLIVRVSGQIVPPVFECIRGDTLFWSPTVSSCGPFVSTDVYRSPAAGGPYTQITSISDANQTSYHDPSMGEAHYFLISNYNCPGLSALPSDTLNNLPPAITTLEKVTVQDNGVLVSWYDNMDQKTIGYIIYRSTAQGTLPIDTVFGSFEYLDPTASADTKSELYYVLAMDQCGNTGFFDMPHQTVHLTTEVDFCDQYIELNWNNYGIWQNGTESVQIWLGLDGNPLAFEHQVQVADTLAYITGIDDEREYCLAIVSKEMGRNVRSFSNVVCVVSDVLSPLDELELRNVSVNNSGGVDLVWYFNSNADLSELLINRREGGSAFNPILDLSNEVPAANQNLNMDQTASTSQSMYTYQLEAEDACGTETLSGSISTVLLRSSSNLPGENNLEWSPFRASSRNFSEYQLCRIETDGSETLISTHTTEALSYTDVLPDPESGAVCYVIKTIHTNSAGGDTLVARSNIACIEQQIGLYIPNAFAPTGFNSVFAPQFVLAGNITNFRMQIFNRWGGKVFESNTPDHGWNGSQNGSLLNTGVYFYLITFQQPDGTFDKRTGTVNLIR